MSFAKEQPKDGDTILHCGHCGPGDSKYMEHPWRWFKLDGPTKFKRPDGTCDEAEWFVACEPCFIKHGTRALNFVRGDGRWTGDAPAIEETEKS